MKITDKITQERLDKFIDELLRIEREMKDKSQQARKDKIEILISKLHAELKDEAN